MNDIKILDVIWYNEIGIVKCLDEITNEKKFYIGVGKGIDEHDNYHQNI